jgi:hypothetical protein
MACHEVDALLRRMMLFCIYIGAPDESLPQIEYRVPVGLEKAPNIITKTSVPLLPAVSTLMADLEA